jgi:hypothetical protein
LILLVMKFLFEFFYKQIPIFYLLKRLLLKFYENGFPYIFFAQELFLSNSLQIGTHVFFPQDLCKTTSYKSNSWTNQTCSKLHKINPSLKLQQELFFPSKSNASQPNWFKSSKFQALAWNQPCLGASWKYLNNHVWWCFVKLYFCVLFILLMVDYLQGIMRMGIPIVWRWWIMLTHNCGSWIMHHPQKCIW